MTRPLEPLLAREILVGQGLARADEDVRVEPLAGGVSSLVLLATTSRRRFVLKQPLGDFRVARPWHVDERRAFVEHAFARALGSLLPTGSLASVRTFLPEPRILVFDAAPSSFVPWKRELLEGRVEPRLGARAGELLAAIHGAGTAQRLRGRFAHPELFRQQRIDPYWREAAQRVPELAPRLAGLEADFARRDDLVHGDFSPKNLLTDGTKLMLVDHEVATRGDGAFDVAFLLAHLVLKALHRPEDARRLRATATEFLHAYETAYQPAGSRTFAYLGSLLVARVVGKSPVEYLNEDGRRRALGIGRGLLQDPPAAWRDVEAQVGTAE